ncbi:hypothetical protein PRNP1_011904 [Phytophthora ramorum]
MRFCQFMLVITVVLLATSSFASASKCGVKTLSAATENIPTVQPLSLNTLKASNHPEERIGGGRAAVAVRSIGGNAVPPNGAATTEGKMVTVTTYDGNGLVQRVGKWWKRTFGGKDARRLRHE